MPVSAFLIETRSPTSLVIFIQINIFISRLVLLRLEELIPLEGIFSAGLRLHSPQLNPLVKVILLLDYSCLYLALNHVQPHLCILNQVFHLLPIFCGTFD